MRVARTPTIQKLLDEDSQKVRDLWFSEGDPIDLPALFAAAAISRVVKLIKIRATPPIITNARLERSMKLANLPESMAAAIKMTRINILAKTRKGLFVFIPEVMVVILLFINS
jgi:hypothetical protein